MQQHVLSWERRWFAGQRVLLPLCPMDLGPLCSLWGEPSVCTNAVIPRSPSPPSLQVVTLACGQHGALCAECPVLWVASAWHSLCLSPALQLVLTWGTNNAEALPVCWGIPTPSLLPMHCRAGQCCVGWGSCGQPSCGALTSMHCRLGRALVPTDCCFGDQKVVLVLWTPGSAGSSTQSTATATARDSPVPAAHLGCGSFFSDDGGEEEMNRSYHHRAAQGQHCMWRQSCCNPRSSAAGRTTSPCPHIPMFSRIHVPVPRVPTAAAAVMALGSLPLS